MRVEMELRNLPRFRVIGYLEDAGGKATEIMTVEGNGWTAYLEALEPAEIGIVRIPRDRLVIEGEETAVERVHSYMRRKTMRGGG